MQPRVIGTETEFGLLIKPTLEDKFHPPGQAGSIRDIVYDFLPYDLKRLDDFMSNGSRYYIDYNAHAEYSTPEDTSIDGTNANEIAGERIVYEGFKKARHKGRVADFSLNKRVIDTLGNTLGYHASYGSDANRLEIGSEYLGPLALHLATVNLFTGAGAVLRNPASKEMRYVIGQKVMGLSTDYGLGTTRDKPLVNLRDEPLTNDKKRCKRLHVTSEDANMSPWSMKMKHGTTSLVLRLIEHKQRIGGDLEFGSYQPLHVIAKLVSIDLKMIETVSRYSGKSIKPMGIQLELIKAARKLSSRVQLPEEELEVMDMWEQAYSDLEKDPMLLADRADWVAKKLVLESYMDTHGVGWNDDNVIKLDHLWANLGPHGLANKLRKTTWKKWMPSEELIVSRITSPPNTTRALLRGNFINRFGTESRLNADELTEDIINAELAEAADATWDKLTHRGEVYELDSPRTTRHSKIEKIIIA
jgi:hypothetical protein